MQASQPGVQVRCVQPALALRLAAAQPAAGQHTAQQLHAWAAADRASPPDRAAPFPLCVPCTPNMLHHCRPSRQLLDANMPQVGIPCFVPLATQAPCASYYFVKVDTFNPEPSSEQGLFKRSSMETLVRPPFPDLKLGPMISQTTFGSLFRGTWSGATVAVKVSIC